MICFDADEPGKKASKEVAELFGQKAKIVKHLSGYKDACDYLIAGATKEFVAICYACENWTNWTPLKKSKRYLINQYFFQYATICYTRELNKQKRINGIYSRLLFSKIILYISDY